MIEAVNSVVSSAPLARGNTDQVDVAQSYAANPSRVQQARPLPQAPYVSPYIHVDVNHNKAVLQIRDGETGDVVRQFPSETTMQLQNAVVQAETAQANVHVPGSDTAQASANAEAQAAAAAFVRAAQTSDSGSSTVVTSA
ncbi:MAG: hypothetical protein IT558_05595 [Alphaproteobacteria bacterium]|nr:hypothetical protein [Alphaproteobacteria bacterium]